jgi:4-amino-4-deoxy-L-arabinose transferase-like glycosyltransferase
MNHTTRTRWLLLALFGLGFLLRLGLAIKLGISSPPEPGSDQKEYDTYAWNVAQGRGYRGMSPDVRDQDHLTAFRPPGPSLVWAGLYRVFGRRYDVVRIGHCLVAAGTILLVYGIGRRCFDDTVGLLAAAAFAVWPISLFYSVQLLSEPLGTLWLLWYLLACLQFAARPTWGRAAGAGLLLGLSLLTRANTVTMLPLAVIWAIWQFRGQRQLLAMSLAIPILGIALLVPWTVRNSMVFGKFIPFSTMGGSVLLQGNNRIVVTEPKYYGYSVWDTEIPEYRAAIQAPNDEVKRDQVCRSLAIQWLKDNPDKWWFLIKAKFLRSWTPFLQPHSPRLYRLGTLLSWGPVLVLFALAFFPTLAGFLRQRHPGWLIHLTILHFTLNAEVFFGDSRYRYPIEPLCLILAAKALVAGLAWLRSGRDVRSPWDLSNTGRLGPVRDH